MSKKKPYTIEFESTHNQWIVVNDQIRSHDPDANYGYYYHKTDAKKVADMLNQRVELMESLGECLHAIKLILRKDGSDDGFDFLDFMRGASKVAKERLETAERQGGE